MLSRRRNSRRFGIHRRDKFDSLGRQEDLVLVERFEGHQKIRPVLNRRRKYVGIVILLKNRRWSPSGPIYIDERNIVERKERDCESS